MFDVGKHDAGVVGLASDSFFLICFSFLRGAVIGGFRESVCQVKEVLRNTDGVQEGTLAIVKFILREKLFNTLSDEGHIEDTLTTGSHLGCYLNHGFHQICKVCRVNVRYFRIDTS